MKFQIDSCSFENSVGEYLDIIVNSHEKYISLKVQDSDVFSLDSELEIDQLCQTLKSLLKAVNGVDTSEIDRRIPGVGC
jgi:hypothetical protein